MKKWKKGNRFALDLNAKPVAMLKISKIMNMKILKKGIRFALDLNAKIVVISKI